MYEYYVTFQAIFSPNEVSTIGSMIVSLRQPLDNVYAIEAVDGYLKIHIRDKFKIEDEFQIVKLSWVPLRNRESVDSADYYVKKPNTDTNYIDDFTYFVNEKKE